MKFYKYKDGLYGYARRLDHNFRDLAVQDEAGNRYGGYGKRPEAELLADQYELVHASVMVARSEAYHTTPPVEITEARFMDALEDMPPGDFQRTYEVSSFYCVEFLSGDVTTHYVRLGHRFFCYNAVLEPHEKRIQRVTEFIKKS